MSKQTKAFLFNLIGFSIIYLVVFAAIYYFLENIVGVWRAVASAVVASILAPKFQTVKSQNGVKLFMKSIFSKEVKEIK